MELRGFPETTEKRDDFVVSGMELRGFPETQSNSVSVAKLSRGFSYADFVAGNPLREIPETTDLALFLK
ncbi:hypothetical protein PN36_17765 [Candidatus Thiomargarita nelsonii]|uniref:Uncharacterized protein n=1 Tax=Candidatus Thiomargarita nelsonii TaxID=1003181 RepID=A0A0A6P1E6_9GAMM|nr:hypothetical protein PN36_17765 [Candidatus Thiomargarita nelsonii]